MICPLRHRPLLVALLAMSLWMGTIAAAERSVSELIQAAKAGSEADRVAAIDELAAKEDKAAPAVNELMALLSDPSAAVRAHAAHALGEIGAAAKPAAAALAGMVKDADEHARRQAVKALTLIRPGPQVMIPLFIQLLEDPDPAVRQRLLNSVSEAGAAAVPGLIEALKHEKAAYWSCVILRQMGPEAKAAIPALTAELKNSRIEVRREAALALGAMQADAKSAAPQIAALLQDANAAEAATFVLGQIGEVPAAAEATIRSNAKSDNKMLSTVSLWTLARVHPEDMELAKQAAEQLIGRIQDADPFVRVAAARALGSLQLKPEITFPIFERTLATADEATTRHAMDALAAIGGKAVPRLTEALKHEKLRVQAAYTLGQIGPEAASATDALAKLLENDNSKVASEAAMALAKIGPAAKGSVPALVAALKKPECPSTHAIVYALGTLGAGSADAKAALVKLMNDDTSVAVLSAWALLQMDKGNANLAVPALIAGLSDAAAESRQMAAQTLGGVPGLSAAGIAALEKAAQDSDAVVREVAAEALSAQRSGAKK